MKGKKILIGVTGGIAAYKSADLVRRLKELECEVRVVMTAAAKTFITPLTLQAVSGHEAVSGMDHIELARWADFILVAPASANFIARLAHGFADDLLATLCLATQAPIAIAPAMNRYMWLNPITQANIQRLRSHQIHIFGPAEGEQACGEVGPGRMLEPQLLIDLMVLQFHSHELAGKKMVITAGPTQEAIDPVRYLSNRSSGKMGHALAYAASRMGAAVTLILGPSNLLPPIGVECIKVINAQQMYAAVLQHLTDCDIFIGAAAVADYSMAEIAEQKIKKSSDTLTLTLKRNPDILATVAALTHRPITIGFAAETENVIEQAKVKLKEKKLDMIIANLVGANQGFDCDHAMVTVIHSNGDTQTLPLAPKWVLATQLMRIIADGCEHLWHSTKRK